MGSVSAGDKMDADFDEEAPFSSTSPSSANTATSSSAKPHSFHFDSSSSLPKSSSSSPSFFNHSLTRRISKSIYIVLIKAKINILLPFGPLAIFLHYFSGGKHVWVFSFALLGIAPLAERLGYATEQLAFYTGPTLGGLLNATFGNATEMIISIYALKSDMIRVVQQSLLGSILSNMLLVLGCAFFTGGIVHYNKLQVFNKVSINQSYCFFACDAYSQTSLSYRQLLLSTQGCC
jgi:Ca2+:H+ antiporter